MKIDLGEKNETEMELDSDSKLYPCIYLNDFKGLSKIPDSGKATIEFKVKEKNVRERDGEKRVSVDLEVRSIDFKEKQKESSENDFSEIEKSMDEVLDKKQDKSEEEEY